jgi:hypothetical protein
MMKAGKPNMVNLSDNNDMQKGQLTETYVDDGLCNEVYIVKAAPCIRGISFRYASLVSKYIDGYMYIFSRYN